MKKISIIVPVYNVEEFLEDCVESIINQTYKDLEVILVDDGSPDECPKICDELAKKDKRIKVIHKENGGLSSARNAGLNIMTGDYVMFVDSDDSIHSQTCEILINNLEKNDADISMATYRNVFGLKGLKERKYDKTKLKVKSYEHNEVFDLIFNKKIPMIMVAWMKLYKKEIFNDLRFENGKLHEDEFIIHKTFYLCKKLVFTNIPLYNYLQRQNSIIKSSFNVKRLHILEALEDRIKFVKENKPQYEEDAILQYMKVCILCYYRAKWANFDISILEDIKNKISSYYKKGYKNLVVQMFYKHPKIMEKIIYLKLK